MNLKGGPRRGRRVAVLVIVVLMAGSIGWLVYFQLSTRGATVVVGDQILNFKAAAVVGNEPAPDFRLPRLDNRSKTLAVSDYRGEVVVLNFWASWCYPCRREAPDLQAAWLDYKDRGVQFIGVDNRDNDAAGLAFVREFGITYPSVVDETGALAGGYELPGLPATFVISAEGRIVYRFIGYIDGPTLRAALDDVLGRDG
ncbi:MAG: TlpA disulfide reductase family protein [Actinomycetota bacterium]